MDFLSDVFEEMSIGISFKSLEYTYTSTFTYLFTFTQGEVSVGSIDPMNFEKKDILMQKLLSLFVQVDGKVSTLIRLQKPIQRLRLVSHFTGI